MFKQRCSRLRDAWSIQRARQTSKRDLENSVPGTACFTNNDSIKVIAFQAGEDRDGGRAEASVTMGRETQSAHPTQVNDMEQTQGVPAGYVQAGKRSIAWSLNSGDAVAEAGAEAVERCRVGSTSLKTRRGARRGAQAQPVRIELLTADRPPNAGDDDAHLSGSSPQMRSGPRARKSVGMH